MARKGSGKDKKGKDKEKEDDDEDRKDKKATRDKGKGGKVGKGGKGEKGGKGGISGRGGKAKSKGKDVPAVSPEAPDADHQDDAANGDYLSSQIPFLSHEFYLIFHFTDIVFKSQSSLELNYEIILMFVWFQFPIRSRN